jgi:hypothetical protein
MIYMNRVVKNTDTWLGRIRKARRLVGSGLYEFRNPAMSSRSVTACRLYGSFGDNSPPPGQLDWIRPRWTAFVSAIGFCGGLALVSIPNACVAAKSGEIDVLWYTYADTTSRYRNGIRRIAEIVHRLPQSGGLRWNLRFFDPTSPRPAFERFNVLVIQSGEAFGTGSSAETGNMTPDFSGILRHRVWIEKARGDRTFLTGADADLHAMNGDSGNAPVREGFRVTCNPPLAGRNCWDGALGHLVNAVNWASQGRGLGIVSMVAAEFPNSRWWLDRDSFLRAELSGLGFHHSLVRIFGPGTRENSPEIPESAARHPLNRGLTSKGLSDWNNSFHAGFSHMIPGYVPIVNSTRYPDLAVAIASSKDPSAPTGGTDSSMTSDGRENR